MQDQINILTKIGLSEKQAQVYSALLELGEAKMTHVARHAKLKRPTVYLIIDELESIGLVSQITKGKKKIYSAVHPKRIGELLEFRKNQFNDLLPELLARYGSIKGKPKVQMLEGVAGVRQAYQEAFTLLSDGKNEGLWFGNISLIKEQFPELLHEYNRILAQTKNYSIKELIFGGSTSKEVAEKLSKTTKQNHSIKYLNDNEMLGATDQLIVGNKIIMFSIREELFTLIIESEELAKQQRFLFDMLWKTV
jgi:sugar-specific transcriptional regulator TrmB